MCLRRSRSARQTPWQQCRSVGERFSRSGTLRGASLGHSVQPDWVTSSDATICRRILVRSTYLTQIWMTALLSSSCGSSKTILSLCKRSSWTEHGGPRMMQKYCQRFPPRLTLHCNLTTIHVAHCNSRYKNIVGMERETMSLGGSQGWSTLEERKRQTNNYRTDAYRDSLTCPKRPSIECTSLVTRTDLAVTL